MSIPMRRQLNFSHDNDSFLNSIEEPEYDDFDTSWVDVGSIEDPYEDFEKQFVVYCVDTSTKTGKLCDGLAWNSCGTISFIHLQTK